MKTRKKYLIINIILFAILFLSISFNKEYLRPDYGGLPFFGILLGSFPNFMAAYIISLFPIMPIIERNIKNGRFIFYAITIIIFSILTIEELHPFFGASTQYDIYDIIANGAGSIFAILTFEIIKLKR